MIDQVRLMMGDCLQNLPKLESGSVDLILTDLPYGTTACSWDSVIPLNPLWDQFRRLIKGNGAIVLTASQPFTTALINAAPDLFKYCWVWEKSRVGDIFNAKNKPLKKHEDILVFSRGTTANGSANRMIYNPQGLRSVNKVSKNTETTRAFFAPRPSHGEYYIQEATDYPTSVLRFSNDTGEHQTQKPVALFEYLISTYSNKGQTVLDCTMGSGTTGVACVNTGRIFIGMERDPSFFSGAELRISEAILKLERPHMITGSKSRSRSNWLEDSPDSLFGRSNLSAG